MSTSSLDSASRSLDRTSRRITVFEQQYDTDALDLACHAAFPFTLTTDLVYCLRENFLPDCPWYAAADILLSGLCDAVGYDLYEMQGETRLYLLARLRDRFTEQRVLEVGDFMAAYILHRLKVEESEQPRLLGDRPRWTALACLRPGEAFNEIQQELQRLGTQADLKERLRLSSLVEGHADLLPGFQSFLIKWADQVADEETIDLEGTDVARARHAGFLLEPREVTVAWIELSDDPLDALPFETQEFEIATVSLEYDDDLEPLENNMPTLEIQGDDAITIAENILETESSSQQSKVENRSNALGMLNAVLSVVGSTFAVAEQLHRWYQASKEVKGKSEQTIEKVVLVSKDKRLLLKNATVEQIQQFLDT